MNISKVTTQEVNEVKEALLNGVIYENEDARYQILITKSGDKLFFHKGVYKSFKTHSAFYRATARMIKRGW